MADPTLHEWKRLVRQHSAATACPLSSDVVDELAAHIADVYAAEREAGRSARQARDAAMAVLARGAYDEVAARSRAAAPGSQLIERAAFGAGSLWRDIGFDVRYAVRGMRRQVGFTLAVVAILAVGIGATTAAYAVIDTVLLRALPYPDSAHLVVLTHVTAKEESRAFAAADWLDYAARHESALALSAYASWPMNVTGGGDPERLRSILVSGNFFDVIGVRPAAGRASTRMDDSPSAPGVVVLSDGFWRRRFGANPSAIGASIVLNGRPSTVVGVMPPDFALPSKDVDLWMPMGLAPDVLADRASEWLSVVGRLRPGIDVRRAQADLGVTSMDLAAAFPRTNAEERAVIRPLLDELVGSVSRPLWLGGLAALFVLLAGSANAANLMLARATLRRDEIAIRAALGAEPLRLARQLLVESAVLAAVGGLLGVSASAVFLRSFVLLADGRVPRIDQLHLNAAALLVAIAASSATALLFGGAAAWLLVRGASNAAGRSDLQRATRRNRLGGFLLAGQVAFATVLIAGAMLVVRAYAGVTRIDPGFDVSDTLTMQLTLPRSRYPDVAARVRFAERTVDELSRMTGVTSVGVVSDLPFVGNALHFPVRPEGVPAEGAAQMTVRLADDGFFRTLRIPVSSGRAFDVDDRSGAAPVAVLNRTAAQRLEGASVGGRIQIGAEAPRIIVGVVGDIKHGGLNALEGPVVYVPFAQTSFAFVNWMGIVARGPGVTTAAAGVRAAVARVDPTQPVTAVQSMEEYVARETAPFRFSSLIVGSLAGIAQVLAMTGIYGLTAFIVGRRSRELGVRLALGASKASIVRLVFKQIAVTLAAGSLAGLAGGVATNGLLKAAIADRSTGGDDALAVMAGGLLVAVSAGLAALGPALRAARLDPKAALQAE
jgi:putative ABC transport system permease protein